ncbi:MAG: hypothetical protein JNL70_26580 [Saprospiraceae bacterium]|nr:hypothetical protein [Saprospiraceae bacterium]
MKNLNELSEKELRTIIRQELLSLLYEFELIPKKRTHFECTDLQKTVEQALLKSVNDFNYQ